MSSRLGLFIYVMIISVVAVACVGVLAQDAKDEENCSECHDELAKQQKLSHKHRPFSRGQCSLCHELAKHKKMTKPERELCLSCHKKVAATDANTRSHKPFTEGCSSCHEAHASKNSGLILKEASELCLGCHKQIAKALKIIKQGTIGILYREITKKRMMGIA